MAIEKGVEGELLDYLDDWTARNSQWAMDEAEEVSSQWPSHPRPMLRDEVLKPRKITGVALAQAIGASKEGKKQTPEQIAKRTASRVATMAAKRAERAYSANNPLVA